VHVGKTQESPGEDFRYFQAIKFQLFHLCQHSLHCFSCGSFSPMTPGGRLNARSQKEEAPVSLSDVPVNGIAIGFLIISQSSEQGSASTRNDWGVRVPARIMMVPAFMVPDNRVSPYVGDTGGPARNRRREWVA